DESHVLIGQLNGMYNGDRARKENLVDYGFRLPSALDNRPLKFNEFERKMRQVVFVSATPADYEKKTSGQVAEQLVRPTGLVDPEIEVRPARSQVDDVLAEINERVKAGDRVLVTVLTKRMAEQLTEFLSDHGVKVRYLHSDIDTVERQADCGQRRTRYYAARRGEAYPGHYRRRVQRRRRPRGAEGTADARQIRGHVRKAACQGAQAPRKTDDGAREKPRVREGRA